MKIILGHLRSIISGALSEAGGGTTMPPRPVVNNPMAPSMADREQIGRISMRDSMDPLDVSPHLMDPVETPEDCYGPVPPIAEKPHLFPDYFSKDFNILPTPQIKR